MISLVHPSRGHITQFYGARQIDGNPHAGQDYAYSNGAEIFPEVYAAADGVVLFAGDSRGLSWPNIMYLNIDFDRSDWQDSSAGNYTIIAHHDAAGNRIALTGYGHQEEVWVTAGQTVSAGQRIGTVGATGFSAGKHLHFDLVLAPFDVDDAPYYGRVNPNGYFTAGTTYNLAGSQLGSTTNTPKEGFLMALSDKKQEDIYWILCTPEGREYLAELVGGRAADKTLNTPIQRGGAGAGIGDGRTSLAAFVAWDDDHTIQLLAATAADAAQGGASVEQIIAAVKLALAESVIKVDVSVEGAK